jgi:trans-aconitate 2-methyltransferase
LLLVVTMANYSYGQKKFPPSDYPNLTYQEGDAKLLNFDNEFDWVVSFSCLHWILAHRPVIEGIKKSLNSSGKIMLQFPLFTPREMSKIDSDQVMKSKKWLNYFANFSWAFAFYETNEYKALLEECGLKVKRVELKQTHMNFQGKEGLRGFIRSTLNFITARIPEELRQEFIGDLVDKSVESNPPDSAGFIYLPLMLLEVEAYTSSVIC